jgi:hypothetical protein
VVVPSEDQRTADDGWECLPLGFLPNAFANIDGDCYLKPLGRKVSVDPEHDPRRMDGFYSFDDEEYEIFSA